MFAWGCKRLPTPGTDKTFELEYVQSIGMDALPQAHTCYFTIDLPKYSSKDAMRKQILYAVENCLSIDEDNEVVDRAEWAHLESAAINGR